MKRLTLIAGMLMAAIIFSSIEGCKKNDTTVPATTSMTVQLTDATIAPGTNASGSSGDADSTPIYDHVYIDVHKVMVHYDVPLSSNGSFGDSLQTGALTIFENNNDGSDVIRDGDEEQDRDNNWITLMTNVGVYDVLTLQNNITALLASNTELPAGRFSKMRIILGDNNSVVIGGATYPLDVTSGERTGIRIKLDTTIPESYQSIDIMLDFNPYKSVIIVKDENSSVPAYLLKPWIKAKSIIII